MYGTSIVYQYSNNVWNQLVGSLTSFGGSVAINSTGDIVAFGSAPANIINVFKYQNL